MVVHLHERPSPTTVLNPISVGSVSLAVRHLEEVSRFYRDVVGLKLIDREIGRVRLGVGNTALLELLHRPDALPRDPAAAGLYHTAFLLPTRADLGRWLAHAATLGLRLDGAADHLVSEAVYLHDPEGNGIEIYADRARSEWHWQAGRVVMANDRLDMIGLRALATSAWTGAPPGTSVGHVHLQVGEIEAAKRFYVGVLGFEVTREWPQAVFLSTGGYHHHLAGNTWHSLGAGPRDPRRAGLASVNLVAADQAILDGIATSAGASDLTTAGMRDPWGTLIQFSTAP
ncbi:MAG: VOC family protein [Acetobacteraceae bacterium]|nr:VOC family protein [Acetobacteraceae bacterium]